jgi:hypothetical protein
MNDIEHHINDSENLANINAELKDIAIELKNLLSSANHIELRPNRHRKSG